VTGWAGLQVGEAGNERVGMRLGFGQQRALERLDLDRRAIASLPDPHAEIERDLVVARACGVQPARHGANQLAQSGLHVHVDVLEFLAEREGPGRHLFADGCEAPLDLSLVLACNDAGLAQHRGVRAGPFQVLGGQPAIEADGDVDRLHQLGRFVRETSAPHRLPCEVWRLRGV
jgi:hypothetical protein